MFMCRRKEHEVMVVSMQPCSHPIPLGSPLFNAGPIPTLPMQLASITDKLSTLSPVCSIQYDWVGEQNLCISK